MNIVKHYLDLKVDSKRLAIFRIVYSSILLMEVVHMFYFRRLIFDRIPFIDAYEINFTIPIIIWIISIFSLILGFKTKISSIINFIFSVIFFGSFTSYEYHMDHIYLTVNFFMMFISVSKSFSIDRLFIMLKYSDTRKLYSPSNFSSQLGYNVLIIFALGFVYFDSVLHKFSTDFWLNGLGIWLPSSYPQTTFLDLSYILNNEFLMKFLGWLTLIFELFFIFIFFHKKLQPYLILIGVSMHIAICFTFPIPFFGLAMASLYILLIPERLFEKIKFNDNTKILVFYDTECPLCLRTKIFIEFFDIFKKVKFLGVQTDANNYKELKERDDLLIDIYSIELKNNIVYNGVDTYIKIFKNIPYFYMLGVILKLPLFYQFSKWIYNKIASTRIVERCSQDSCTYIAPTYPSDNDNIQLLNNYNLKDLKILVISIGLFIITSFQFFSSSRAPIIMDYLKNNLSEKVYNSIDLFTQKMLIFSNNTLGITTHAVFTDYHFENYNHVIAIKYKNRYLPLTNSRDKHLTTTPEEFGPNLLLELIILT